MNLSESHDDTDKIAAAKAALRAAVAEHDAQQAAKARAAAQAKAKAQREAEAAAEAERERIRKDLEERFLSDAERERRAKRAALLRHLEEVQAHHHRNDQYIYRPPMESEDGTKLELAPLRNCAAPLLYVSGMIESLRAEERMERDFWSELVTATLAMERTRRGGEDDPHAPLLRLPRDISGSGDRLIILCGRSWVRCGRYGVRTGDVLPAGHPATADIETVLRALEASIAQRLTPEARALHGWDDGAWIVAEPHRFGRVTEQCPLAITDLVTAIADAPTLAFAWLRDADTPAAIRPDLEAIIDKHAHGDELRAPEGFTTRERIEFERLLENRLASITKGEAA